MLVISQEVGDALVRDSSQEMSAWRSTTGALSFPVRSVDVIEIEEIWHGLHPPYADFFAWLEGRAERPVSASLAPFRPVMLAQALDECRSDL